MWKEFSQPQNKNTNNQSYNKNIIYINTIPMYTQRLDRTKNTRCNAKTECGENSIMVGMFLWWWEHRIDIEKKCVVIDYIYESFLDPFINRVLKRELIFHRQNQRSSFRPQLFCGHAFMQEHANTIRSTKAQQNSTKNCDTLKQCRFFCVQISPEHGFLHVKIILIDPIAYYTVFPPPSHTLRRCCDVSLQVISI